jgi:tetratricopeptide (TPR) repeat protein
MPFGKKSSALGSLIDFDAIYQDLIYPAIKDSGLEPLRADEEMTGGIIHKPMFERLILCEYAVADLTNANANVFYELGVRHAVRPWSTVLLYAKESGQLPFDVAPLRAMAYHLTPEGAPQDLLTTRAQLLQNLIKAKESQNSAIDSPIFQLVEGFPQIDHIKTDVFRDRVSYSARIKEQIADARIQGREALMRLERELGNMNNIESETVMVQEQLALALNRGGKGEQAERVLLDLLEKRGPSSETYGILGRIYKDRWETAFKSGDEILAMGLLDQAIEAYVHGFEADWRDAYPGINAVTLMEIKEPPDPRRLKMIPVVEYAVERRIGAGKPDYWDYATRLELAVLAKDKELAVKSLSSALTLLRESWEAETTVRNLRLIRQAREFRQDIVQWYSQIEQRLETRSNQI